MFHSGQRRACLLLLGGVGLLVPSSALAASDLSATLEDRPDPARVGLGLVYTLTVSNAGPDPAPNVIAAISLPEQVDVLRASARGHPCTIGRTTTCVLGALGPGAQAVTTVTVRPHARGRLMAAGTATPGGTATDPNPYNDLTVAETRVKLSPGACANLRVGTSRPDVLRATGRGDAIFGRRGDDRLDGAAGTDCLSGQQGDDRLFGGSGLDQLFGDSGDDSLKGGDDDDRLLGSGGDDVLVGGPGQDELRGGGGNDRFEGIEAAESAFGGPGGDVMDGAGLIVAGTGDDRITAAPGARVRCGPGRDTVVRTPEPVRLVDCEEIVVVRKRGITTGGGGLTGGGGAPRRPARGRCRGRRCTCRRRYCPPGGPPAALADLKRFPSTPRARADASGDRRR